MPKRSGLGDRLYFNQYDLSGDVGAVQTLRQSRAVQDVTGIDKDAVERLGVLPDGELAFTALWNDSASQSYPVLSALPTTDVVASYFMGTAIGNAAASLNGKLTDLSVNRGQDGSLALTIPVLGNGSSLDWGVQLTNGKVTLASSGTAAPVDHGASTAFGGVAYLHVFSIGSGTATVKVQHSSDNATYADLITFTAATAATFERKLTAAITTTVNRYTSITVTGTFTNLVYAVNFMRYVTSQT